jgi:hypothetical protein
MPMTEAEWLNRTDPQKMLLFLRGEANDRKLRPSACACCHRIWPLLGDEGSRRVVEVAERRADGEASGEEILAGMKQANVGHIQAIAAMMSSGSRDQTDLRAKLAALYTLQPDTASAVRITIKCAAEAMSSPQGGLNDPSECSAPALMAEKQAQTALVRDIFGNPFRPVAVDPSWLTPGVVELARTIYEGRAFDRMPELANALEEAGCANADILAHCREPGEHVRGCWVLDLLLGKEWRR